KTIDVPLFFFLKPISLVRPRRRLSLAPTAGYQRRQAQGVSRVAALSAATPAARRGLGLDMHEHDGTLDRSGPDSFSCVPSSLAFHTPRSALPGALFSARSS